MRRSAVRDFLRYLSNHAEVYQAISSAPRSDAPNAWLGMKLKSRCEPPRMMICPVSMPASVYFSDSLDLASGFGSSVFGVGGRK